tara:strand:+ start:31 stop:4425 length:4395 start_codon:yes stop_codon:yes gene_type:complete
MRKLLPYEHQLIEALGVTKEEYLNFVAIQKEYKDPKFGTALDIRNGPGVDYATVALVLTIVGTLFQVGAALLAPKPEIPDTGSRRRNRQQRFAPSFGFNSAQDLAKYGDPVNLIYTNSSDNPLGSVRASGSLVWSQIENFGSSQFMQLMVVIGASKLKKIDFNSIAFGQKDLSSFEKGSFYVFSKLDGDPGVPTFDQLRAGHDKTAFFPTRLKPDSDAATRPACLIAFQGDKREGFSQAYTPTSATSLGVFDVIPINVDVLSRDEDGEQEQSNIKIKLSSYGQDGTWKNNVNGGIFGVDDRIELIFSKAKDKGSIERDKAPGKTAIDMRRQMLEGLDFSSTYVLGSARFRFETFRGTDSNRNIEEGDVKVGLKCIEGGAAPSSKYDTTKPKQEDLDLKTKIENAIHILKNTQKTKEVDTETVDANGNPIFETKQIVPTIDPETNEPYPLSDEGNFTDAFEINSDIPSFSIAYNSEQEVNWIPKLNLVDDSGNKIEDSEYALEPKFINVPRAGSIAFSQEKKEDLQDDQTIDVSKVRKKLRKQKKALKALVEDILAGVYNGENLPQGNSSYGPPWSAHSGRDPAEKEVSVYVLQSSRSFLFNNPHISRNGGPELHGYEKDFIGGNTSNMVRYTFLYIDRYGTWHFFPFNGIEDQGKQKFFPNDDNLKIKKRPNLKDAKEKLSDLQAERDQLVKDTTKIKEDSVTDPTKVRTVLTKETQLAIAQYESDITAQEELVEERRQAIKERIDRNFSKMHKLAINLIEDDIDYIESVIEQLPSVDQKDSVGRTEIRKAMKKIIKEKEEDLQEFERTIDNWDFYRGAFDNSFFSKCLVKAEKASYETLSEIDTINFSLKVKLFRRISGRQRKYGEEKVDNYSSSDNGVKSRMVFFRMYYKKQGGDRQLFDIVFAVRRGSESDFYTQIRFKGSDGTAEQPPSKWSFEFEPVHDISAERKVREFNYYAFLEDTSENPQVWPTTASQVKVSWSGRTVTARELIGYFPDEDERGPIDTNEWDMFSVNSDTNVQFSHEAGPEVTLTAVTEQQFARGNEIFDKYGDLTMMAIGVYANRGLQELRSVSALVKKGKGCKKINVSSNELSDSVNSSSFAPDIFVDTLLDKTNGVGNYVSQSNIDIDSLVLAKKFCRNNHLPKADGTTGDVTMFMDGIIADASSWREFWINAAPFSLLELARKNGKDTLVPALPVNNGTGRASLDNGKPVSVDISALFTAGNVLEGSYKEEFLNYGASTEDLIASVVYREFRENEVFYRNRTVDVRIEGVGDEAVRETFDLSQFVTQREQAIMFAKLLCNQRRYIRKGIEFRTLPSEAGLEPGAFIYVDIGVKTWDHYSSGMVMKGGELNTPLRDQQNVGSDNFNFLLYKPNTSDFKTLTDVSVQTTVEGVSTASSLSPGYEGYMFVMGLDKPDKRVFRITELAIEEQGELSVKAVEYPCFDDNGVTRAHIADFRSSNFEVS